MRSKVSDNFIHPNTCCPIISKIQNYTQQSILRLPPLFRFPRFPFKIFLLFIFSHIKFKKVNVNLYPNLYLIAWVLAVLFASSLPIGPEVLISFLPNSKPLNCNPLRPYFTDFPKFLFLSLEEKFYHKVKSVRVPELTIIQWFVLCLVDWTWIGSSVFIKNFWSMQNAIQLIFL